MFHRIFENKIYKKHREKILLFLDLCIVFIAYILAYWSKNDFKTGFKYTQMMTSSELICWGVIILLIYMICSYVFKVYKSLWKYIGLDELLRLSISNIIATAFIMIISMFYFGESSLISIEFIAGIFAVIMMSGLRVSYRLLRRIESNRNSKIQEKELLLLVLATLEIYY